MNTLKDYANIYVRSCNALNELSNKVCVPNKTEDLNLSMFDIITGIIKNINKAYIMRTLM